MRARFRSFIILPALALAACSSKDKAADTSLSTDLSLAAQARQNAVLDSVTAAERLRASTAVAATPAPVTHTATTTTHHSSTVHHSASGGNVSSAPASHEEVVKHTNRDAAIGAAAGAVLGGTTHGVKGGLIGAAAGGILGAVVGNNVDKQKKKVP